MPAQSPNYPTNRKIIRNVARPTRYVPDRYIIKITFANGETTYLQGFDVCGNPITGVRETAHPYPKLLIADAQENVKKHKNYFAKAFTTVESYNYSDTL